jgi:hypothetical protein
MQKSQIVFNSVIGGFEEVGKFDCTKVFSSETSRESKYKSVTIFEFNKIFSSQISFISLAFFLIFKKIS